MTPAECTAEQRAAYKTRADRVQEIVRTIEQLEGWKQTTFKRLETFGGLVLFGAQPEKVWRLGIDTLIAQLEQELADLDRPKVATIPQFSVAKQECLHISRDILDNCMECGKSAADLGTLTEKQIARYPVIDKNPRPSTSTAGSVLSYDPHRILSTAGGGQ